MAKQESKRNSTGFDELDRVLGGGLVKGSLILLGGEPVSYTHLDVYKRQVV